MRRWGTAIQTRWVGRDDPNTTTRDGMWVDDDGIRYFTCQDLHDAGVTIHWWAGGIPHQGSCCPQCHGWGEWREHPAGVVEHQLPTGDWLICCCCWTFSRPDAWVVQKLNAWRRVVRRSRQRRSRGGWGRR